MKFVLHGRMFDKNVIRTQREGLFDANIHFFVNDFFSSINIKVKYVLLKCGVFIMNTSVHCFTKHSKRLSLNEYYNIFTDDKKLLFVMRENP